MPLTRVKAARRFFLGGSGRASDDEVGTAAAGSGTAFSGFSSTLAAGVNGGSATRFIGTTGVNAGDMVGRAEEDAEGVERGVVMLEASGSE